MLPWVESDQLMGAGGFSMPLVDIIGLEIWGFSLDRTVCSGLLPVGLCP